MSQCNEQTWDFASTQFSKWLRQKRLLSLALMLIQNFCRHDRTNWHDKSFRCCWEQQITFLTWRTALSETWILPLVLCGMGFRLRVLHIYCCQVSLICTLQGQTSPCVFGPKESVASLWVQEADKRMRTVHACKKKKNFKKTYGIWRWRIAFCRGRIINWFELVGKENLYHSGIRKQICICFRQ